MIPKTSNIIVEPRSLSQTAIPAIEFPVNIRLPSFTSKLNCGFPSPAETYGEPELDIAAYIIRNKAASFWLTTEGDSMIDIGIHPGSKVLVDRSINAMSGHLVVAVIDGEYTLKLLHIENGVVELRAANPKYQPIRFADEQTLEIFGVVVACVRKFSV
jgi:DNA polymerase V